MTDPVSERPPAMKCAYCGAVLPEKRYDRPVPTEAICHNCLDNYGSAAPSPSGEAVAGLFHAHGCTPDAPCLLCENTSLRTQLTQAQAEVEKLREILNRFKDHILDIVAHATAFGDLPDEPGFTGTYLVTAGSIHRAIGAVGHTSPSCDAEAKLSQQQAHIDQLTRARDDLAAKLLRYGRHDDLCSVTGGYEYPCTCGYTEALSVLQAPSRPTDGDCEAPVREQT